MATLSIEIMHKSLFHDQLVARISAPIETLLDVDKAHDHGIVTPLKSYYVYNHIEALSTDVTLKLQPPTQRNRWMSGNVDDFGSIVIQLSVKNTSDGPKDTIVNVSQGKDLCQIINVVDQLRA
jgi:hypothetical protein